MKVKCVNKKYFSHLTLDKMYDVHYETFEGSYFLEDDTKESFYYPKDCFIVICDTLEELELENKIALLEKDIKKLKQKLEKLIRHKNDLLFK